MGMLSPLGTDVPSSWQGILAGHSGIGLIEHTDLSAYSTRFGGSVKGFNVEEYLSIKESRKLDLFIQYGLAAGFQAVRNAGLEVTDANRDRIGVAMQDVAKRVDLRGLILAIPLGIARSSKRWYVRSLPYASPCCRRAAALSPWRVPSLGLAPILAM